MGKLEEAENPFVTFDEQASNVATPGSGLWRAFFKSDGLYVIDDAGAVTGPFATSAGVPAFVGARAVANAATLVGTSAWTSVAFAGADRHDTHGFHDPAVTNSRIIVPTGRGGYYDVTATVGFVQNATGLRGIRFLLNGATRIGGEVLVPTVADGANGWRMTVTTNYLLVAGDYVEVQVWQNSGGNLNTENIANGSGEFMVALLGT